MSLINFAAAFLGEVLHAMTNRHKYPGPCACYSVEMMTNADAVKTTNDTEPNSLNHVAEALAIVVKPLVELTVEHLIKPALELVVGSITSLVYGAKHLAIDGIVDCVTLVSATGSELSFPVSNALVSVGIHDLDVPHLERSIYISKAFVTFIGCVSICLALSCGVIRKDEAIVLLAILQCFSVNVISRFMIGAIVGWFARVPSFNLNKKTRQVTQRVSSATILVVDEVVGTESSSRSISMPSPIPFELLRDLSSNNDKQCSMLTLVARSIASLKEELLRDIVKSKLALSKMLRPSSKPTPSFALSIARQDGVQTLATSGSARLCSNDDIGSIPSILETCLVAFFCMVVVPLIGAFAAVVVVVLTVNWSSVCQILLLSVSAVTFAMLSTVVTVGFRYAWSTDNVSIHGPNCNDVQCPSESNALSSTTAVPPAEACPNDAIYTLEQSSMLVGDDLNTKLPNTENASTDLSETCFIALFCMVCLPLMGVAATIMMMVIATSEYFCYETVLQTLMIATCANIVITSGVASSLVRSYISFYIGWVVYFENKTLDTLDWIGLDSLADDISRLFDFISRRFRARKVQFNREDTVHITDPYILDLSWALDKTAAINYFRRRRILLFIQGWEIERQLELLPPNLCASLDRMQKWWDVDEIATFLREYETLATTKQARRLHAQQFCTVLDELMLNTNTASTPTDAQTLSSLGNVASEPATIHVDEPIDATMNNLCSTADKSEHSQHSTTISELIESCRIALLVMLFAPLVGVGTVMILLVLISIAASCGCISIIQALVFAISCVYIIVTAFMKLRGTVNGIHFNTIRDMCVTSIASITSYVGSCINQLRRIFCCIVWQLVGYFQQHSFMAFQCALSGLRHIRMRMKLSSFVTSCRAIISGIMSITLFVGSRIIQLQPVIQYINTVDRKYSTVVPHTRERASPSTATYGQSKGCRISGSRRSRKKRQYHRRKTRRSRRPHDTSFASVDKLMWFISDACNSLLKLCIKVNAAISDIIGRALARFHCAVIITFKCIIFTCIVGTASLNTVGLHRGVFQAALIVSNGVLAHQAALHPTDFAASHFHEQHINSGLLAASREYHTGDFPWHQVNAKPFLFVDVDTRHVDTLFPFASSETFTPGTLFPFVVFPTPRHESNLTTNTTHILYSLD